MYEGAQTIEFMGERRWARAVRSEAEVLAEAFCLFIIEALLETTRSEGGTWKRMTKSSPRRHVEELNRYRSP